MSEKNEMTLSVVGSLTTPPDCLSYHEVEFDNHKPLPPTPSEMAGSMDSSGWVDDFDSESELSPPLDGPGYPFQQEARARHPPSSHPQSPPHSSSRSPALTRSASAGEPLFRSDAAVLPPSFERPSKSLALPDPSQYPDPYPSHHLHSMPPGLSSADSSSTSTRSSAYTSFGSGLHPSEDQHIHVAVRENDEPAMGVVRLGSSNVVEVLNGDPIKPPADYYSSSRTPVDQSRWSGYSGGTRSRSSSLAKNINNGNSTQIQEPVHKLRHQPSFDASWQPQERDEVGMSGDETDDDHILTEDEYDEDLEEERHSAIVIAEEGRGLIIQGSGASVAQLNVQPGAPFHALFMQLKCSWSILQRYYTFARRIFSDPQLNSDIPYLYAPGHTTYASGLGHICQLPQRTSPVPHVVHTSGRAEHSLQSAPCPSLFPSRHAQSPCFDCGFDRHHDIVRRASRS